MTVSIEKLRQFQQQHLESQVQCGDEVKSVPKAGCVKEWALVEIALNLHALNDKLDKVMRQPGLADVARQPSNEARYRPGADDQLPGS
jgi:hypothetical protein